MLYTIVYENERNERIDFEQTPEIVITDFTGFGEVDVDIQSQKAPYQDGSVFIDALLSERPVSLDFLIKGKDYAEVVANRRRLSRVFNPKLQGQLTVTVAGRSYIIDVVPEHAPNFPSGSGNQGQQYQKGVIDLIAHDPYWRDPNETSKPLHSYVGNFTFPFELPIELGVAGSHTTLYNEGDVPAPVRIDIQGPVTNPRIINNTTGEWIRVNVSVAHDEILHIDTTPGRKRAEIYRGVFVSNAFGYLDHDSDWLTLTMGENDIEHIADAGDNDSLVAVTWNDQYIGI